MEPAKIEAWQRFREQVLRNSGWPRTLWFAALEDGLRAGLGEQSALLAEFRRDRAELLQLESRASGSYQDGRRIVQLEAQIRQLVERADQSVLDAEPHPTRALALAPVSEPAAPRAAAVRARPRRRGLGAPAATVLMASVLLALLAIAGTSVYYENRIEAQTDRQAARIEQLIDTRAAALRAEIEQRLASVDESGAVDNLRARNDGLGRTLDGLSLDVSSLEMRVPALDEELERIGAGAGQMADELDRATSQIKILKKAAPELTTWLARQKDDLERDVEGRREMLSGITARVQTLVTEVDQSRSLLAGLNQSLLGGLEQARKDGELLRSAVEEMQATGLEVAKLMEGAETRVQTAHDAMQQKIDRMLTDLAEQADLAVLRGADVIRRAEGEVGRRVDAASSAALEAAAQERTAQLGVLAEQVAATQAELEQTRSGLIESWERMDQNVAERQSEVLTSLEAYAGTIGVRVEELLQALDLMVARSGG